MPKIKTLNLHKVKHSLPPTILTIFGATGALSSDYLLPALLRMDDENLLPKDFRLVCVGRRGLSAEAYLDFIVKKSSILEKLSLQTRKHFLQHLIYFQGDFDNLKSFQPLARLLEDQNFPEHQCFNRLYYFATNPQYFAAIARILKQTRLLSSCETHKRRIRILVEKPFGFNFKSARALNQLLLKYFNEDQIYRIDHYLGKETVQNLLVVRFANSLFEPLWNNRFIDYVEISVLEKEGVGTRAKFYDQTGALKDMVQNHVLQMLALIAMEEPYNLTPQFIRDEKVKVLKALAPFTKQKLTTDLIKAQYAAYPKEAGQSSDTETLVALKAFVNLPRWLGVPFYLRTGKKLSKKLTEISIHFREPVRCLFSGCAVNVLTFRIQPDESVHLQINNKIPGFGVKLHQGDFEFGYNKAFTGGLPTAYERLLLDFIEGDQRLFIRSDEIEAAWKFIDSITDSPQYRKLPLFKYRPGTNGPKEADEFIKKDLREWWTR
jgi:glucose-6-phosphate 1-dehydrogenase